MCFLSLLFSLSLFCGLTHSIDVTTYGLKSASLDCSQTSQDSGHPKSEMKHVLSA